MPTRRPRHPTCFSGQLALQLRQESVCFQVTQEEAVPASLRPTVRTKRHKGRERQKQMQSTRPQKAFQARSSDEGSGANTQENKHWGQAVLCLAGVSNTHKQQRIASTWSQHKIKLIKTLCDSFCVFEACRWQRCAVWSEGCTSLLDMSSINLCIKAHLSLAHWLGFAW